MLLKIGELARRTGLTVRTLHHYDAIGLLSPSARSDAGYRLYDRGDIERLHRIQALRRLDLSLAEIGELLQGGGADLPAVIEQQIAALDRQVARATELRERLQNLRSRLLAKAELDMSQWLTTLEMMAIYDRYFTSEDLRTVRGLKQSLDKEGDSQWPALIASVRGAMAKNIAPDTDEALALAERWVRLMQETMGGDPRITLLLDAMHRNEPAIQAHSGIDGELLDFVAKATSNRRLRIYEKYLSPQEIAPVRGKFDANHRQWPTLIAEVREQMRQGASPGCGRVQALAVRWRELVFAVWGNDPALLAKLRMVNTKEPDLFIGTGIDEAMLDFMRQAFAQQPLQTESTTE